MRGVHKVSFSAKRKTAYSCLNALMQQFDDKHDSSAMWGVNRDPVLPDAFIWFRTEPQSKLKGADASSKGSASRIDIRTESARPLADALILMAKGFGQSTVYEDPPYLCSCAVMKDRANNPYSPRGGIFEATYSSGVDPVRLLDDELRVFNNDNDGKFVAESIRKVLYVHPTELMNEKEKVLPLQSLLKMPMAIAANGKPAAEILKNFCDALAAQSKQKVTLGTFSSLPNSDRVLTYEGTKRPAIEHLITLTEKITPKLSWQLLYEPRLKGYVLNAHVVE